MPKTRQPEGCRVLSALPSEGVPTDGAVVNECGGGYDSCWPASSTGGVSGGVDDSNTISPS